MELKIKDNQNPIYIVILYKALLHVVAFMSIIKCIKSQNTYSIIKNYCCNYTFLKMGVMLIHMDKWLEMTKLIGDICDYTNASTSTQLHNSIALSVS